MCGESETFETKQENVSVETTQNSSENRSETPKKSEEEKTEVVELPKVEVIETEAPENDVPEVEGTEEVENTLIKILNMLLELVKKIFSK